MGIAVQWPNGNVACGAVGRSEAWHQAGRLGTCRPSREAGLLDNLHVVLIFQTVGANAALAWQILRPLFR